MTNARSLANFATGIGTEGAVLTVDNTNNRIGIATTNPQNDLQVGLGITMEGDTGQVTFVGVVTASSFSGDITGTASNASGATGDFSIADKIVHTGDTNTAIRFPAADTFTVETGGSERIRVTDGGLVGIGTAAGSSSSTRLVVYEESGNAQTIEIKAKNTGGVGAQPGIRFTAPNNDNIGAIYGDVNSDSLKFATGTVERLSVNSSGNVGIATTNPLGRLSLLADDSQADADIVFQTSTGIGLAHAALSTTDDSGGTDLMVGSNFFLSTNGAETRFNTGRSGTAIRFGYSGTMRFYTNSGSNAPTERLRITSAGDVGIGSDTPARKLDVNGPVRVIETVEAYDTSGGSQDWFVSSASFGFHNGTGVAFNAGGGLFRLGISGSEKVRVDAGGNVNITGITTATQLFEGSTRVATTGKAIAMAMLFG